MQEFIDFISFKDPNVVYVLLGMLFINSSTALIGTFAYLRKRSLIGDAIAHSLLPGICLGFLAAGEKSLPYLLAGAFVSGWLSTFAVDLIVSKTKVKQDAAIGIVLSTFFALGIVLLTYIQKSGTGKHAGLDHFLFGQAAAITRADIWVVGVIFLVILLMIILFYRAFIVVSFNHEFAQSVGLPEKLISFFMTSLTVLAIAAGIQALGVVLISALIITPAATARMWTHYLKKILVFAAIISVVSGIGGAYVSYANSGMPTGPWVVVFLAFFVFVSIVIAPGKGLISKYKRTIKNNRKILHENILKAIYQFHENQGNHEMNLAISIEDLLSVRNFDTAVMMKGLKLLIKEGFIKKVDNKYQLTEGGIFESQRVVKLHRLWEQYLLKRTQIDTDHVHSGAEAIEHIITPEIEKELERELGIDGIPKEDY
ncbi:metal ABC transporter permease [Paracrocinitomix mangrovi]|uniref:metal ABC transporter permease n=1 Tax=Paracrocinitomix mangrovi TaxID=2862509 RepID=UPI001C8E3253|nr:metal ABC transporter permease [Paracrocinitomix mangrovi]UKN02889.1 metal ABC transporter permease [Paracrocinitomix mangrovi]